MVIVFKTVNFKDISEEEANSLTKQDRYRSIQSNAVTCARYFDYRYRQILKLFNPPTVFLKYHNVLKLTIILIFGSYVRERK